MSSFKGIFATKPDGWKGRHRKSVSLAILNLAGDPRAERLASPTDIFEGTPTQAVIHTDLGAFTTLAHATLMRLQEAKEANDHDMEQEALDYFNLKASQLIEKLKVTPEVTELTITKHETAEWIYYINSSVSIPMVWEWDVSKWDEGRWA